MDAVHAELEALLQRARATADAGLFPVLELVDTHLRGHFGDEDRWMLETAFPARECHMDEHAAVLASSGGVLRLAAEGDCEPGRRFLDELGRWFPAHADYLDSALAAWMCKRQYGGRPVVLHRPAGRMPHPSAARKS